MPGEDGYWRIKSIRAMPPEQGGTTPAIALTASISAADEPQLMVASFQRYLPTPVEIAELCDTIQRLAT